MKIKTIREIDLKNSYKILLRKGKAKKQLIQYIEADNMEEALKKAKKTFSGSLYLLCNDGFVASMSQKACELTLCHGKYKFYFDTGWFCIDISGLNIFQGLQKLKNDKRFIKFSKKAPIIAIEKEF